MKQFRTQLLFALVALILFVASSLTNLFALQAAGYVVLALLSYRYGYLVYISLATGGLAGVSVALLHPYDLVSSLVVYLSTIVVVMTSGFFAKNVHRTLNNKRYVSVWLNVVTASVLTSVVLFLVGYIYPMESSLTVTNVLLYTALHIIVVMAIAYIQPTFILTRRSAFLTSKERSKLLND